MKLNGLVFVISVLVMGASFSVWAERHIYKQLTLPVEEVVALHAETSVRNLTIRTQPNLNVIQVRIYLPHHTLHESGYLFELVKMKEIAELKVYPNQREHEEIDLEVLLPKFVELMLVDGASHVVVNSISSKVKIQDGAGDLMINQVDKLTVIDKSGNIHIDNQGSKHASYIQIQDGSGAISIANVRGDIEINDKSGAIVIRDIQGNVKVKDGSGDIVIKEVSEDVVINDGSGDILVHSSGSLAIIEPGSGTLNYDGIKGAVIVK